MTAGSVEDFYGFVKEIILQLFGVGESYLQIGFHLWPSINLGAIQNLNVKFMAVQETTVIVN